MEPIKATALGPKTDGSEQQEIELAAEFAAGLGQLLGSADCAQIVALNARSINPGTCASHDFCDANMVMAAAFERLFKKKTDTSSEVEVQLWNNAWNLAKAGEFNPQRIRESIGSRSLVGSTPDYGK